MRVSVLAVSLAVAGGLMVGPAVEAQAAGSQDPTGVTASVQGLNVAVSWQDGDPAGVTGYLVSTVPASPTVTEPAGATSAVLTAVRPGVSYAVAVAAMTAGGPLTAVAAPGTVRTAAPGGSFVALRPARLLDTRIGFGAPKGATTLARLTVTGRGGVPATGVSAVALNVTVTGGTGGGYVTAYPAGQARPVASNLNFVPRATAANLVVVPVGAGGAVDLYASARTQLVADVSGYYTTAAAASPATGLFHPVAPARLLDTRSGTGGTTPGPGGTVNLTVTGVGGIPATGVSAVVLNTTVTAPSSGGYVTVYPAGGARPGTSSINFVAGQTIANRVVVPVGANGQVSFYNPFGRTPLVADVTGWYTDGSDTSAGGAYYVAVAPHRLVDTRIGTGAPRVRVAAGGVVTVQVAGQDRLPAAGADIPVTAAALTVTLVNPVPGTFATVYPSLSARPLTSDVNVPAHTNVPNLALTGLGVDGAVAVYNALSPTDLVVDLAGYYVGAVDVPSSTTVPPPGAVTAVSGDPAATASVTLAAGTPVPPVGQIIAAGVTPATPEGLLVQVTGTSTDGSGRPVVTTQPATLQQAIGDADIDLSVPLGAQDLAAARSSQAVRVPQLRARATGRAALDPISGASHQPCSGDAGSGVDITDSFTPSLVFEAHLGHSGLKPTISARAGIDISEQVAASVSFAGRVSCAWHTQLAQYTFRPVEFSVAAVPVVIVPHFTLDLDATASGQAQLSASVSQRFDAQAGLQDDRGTVSPYHSITNTVSHTGPTLTAANATALIAVTGDLQGKLYGITGPDVSLTATVTARADPTASPWWTIGLTLTGHAGLHLSVLDHEVDVQVTISLLATTVATATGPPTGAPPVIVTTALTDATLSEPYQAELTTADHRSGTWSVVAGALPAGLSLSGFTIAGTPTVIGTATFTLRFVDTTGHTVQAPATLAVLPSSGGATPSSVEGTVTDPDGNRLAGVVVGYVSADGLLDDAATTNSAGGYDFDLPPGSYTLCFDGTDARGGSSDATGYIPNCFYGTADGQPVQVRSGTATTADATLAVGGAMSGNLIAPPDAGLGSVHALMEQVDGSQPGIQVEVGPNESIDLGADDSYAVKGLPSGTYHLCLVPAEADPTGDTDGCYGDVAVSQIDSGTDIGVTVGRTIPHVDITLSVGGGVAGTVTDTAGNPLDLVPVTVTGVSSTTGGGFDNVAITTWSGDGDYFLGHLSPGTDYTVCFNSGNPFVSPLPGYGSQCYDGVAPGGSPTLVTVQPGQSRGGINGVLPTSADSAVVHSRAVMPQIVGSGRGCAERLNSMPLAVCVHPWP